MRSPSSDASTSRCTWAAAHEHSSAPPLANATDLLAGREPTAETPAERCFIADAKVMVADFRSRFPWIREAPEAEIAAALNGMRDRLVDVAITGSRNHELTHTLY